MPRIRLGALVIFISNHPSTEPMIKVMRTFSGMNHLHNSTTVGFKKLAGKKKKNATLKATSPKNNWPEKLTAQASFLMLRILPSCSQQVLDSGHKTQAAQQLSLKIHIIVIRNSECSMHQSEQHSKENLKKMYSPHPSTPTLYQA
jgi:hypothetical protein